MECYPSQTKVWDILASLQLSESSLRLPVGRCMQGWVLLLVTQKLLVTTS